MALLDEIKLEFKERNFEFEDEEIAENCFSLCSAYSLDPSDLATSWEVFTLNMQIEDGTVTHSLLPSFQLHIAKEQKAEILKKENFSNVHFYTGDTVEGFLKNVRQASASIFKPKVSQFHVDHEFLTTPKNPIPSSIVPYRRTGETNESNTTTEDLQNGSMPTENSEDLSDNPFKRRTNKQTVMCAFNDHLEESVPESSVTIGKRRREPIESWQVESQGIELKPGCRYMYDRLEDRFNALDERILAFTGALSEAVDSFEPSKQNFYASQEHVMVVGRICCEAEGGRLNEKSVLLEASSQYGHGQRVRLDLRNIPSFSIFPGQIVAVEGENPSGFCLVASRIIDSLPLPTLRTYVKLRTNEDELPAKKGRRERGEEESIESQASVRVIVAAGPFTTTDNLAFEPLETLFSVAKEKEVDLIVLIGPFVDSEHPKIKNGTLDISFEHVFQEQVRTRVENYCSEMGEQAKVVLLPSTRDSHHDAVFPQPPFNRDDFEISSNQMLTLGNPGVFSFGQVGIAATSMDVLRHLSGEEISKVSAGSASLDRMTRLVSHLIGQQCFYPLFPPPLGSLLDLSVGPPTLRPPFVPDLLLLPSDLGPFVKVIPRESLSSPQSVSIDPNEVKEENRKDEKKDKRKDETLSYVCINPGRLAKGKNGGTYADISIIMDKVGENNSTLDLSKHAKINIVRI